MEEKCETNSFCETDSISEPSIFKDSGSEFIPCSLGSESGENEENNNIFGIPAYQKNDDLRKNKKNKNKRKNICKQKSIKKIKPITNNTAKKIRTIMKNRQKEVKSEEIRIEEKKSIGRRNDKLEKIIYEIDTTSLHSENNGETGSSVSLENQKSTKKVFIESSKINEKSGKRIRDKVHCCLFCDKLLINIARHYELLHKNEIRVARILSMPKGSKARKEAFDELHKIADFHYNCGVLNQNSGELILVRRPSRKEVNCELKDYGPCPNCLGFMIKKTNLVSYKISL